MRYPETRIDDATDDLAGISFPDPFRWLEDDHDPAVRAWQQAQSKLARSHVRAWPPFDRLRDLVARYHSPKQLPLPRFAAGHWFRMGIPADGSHSCAMVADEPYGAGRVLFDPADEDADRPPFLSWISPSPDGRTLALGVCADGSENNTIRLIDVQTATRLPDAPAYVLPDAWSGGAHWLADSSGFFFTALGGGTSTELLQEVYLHRRRPTPATEPVEVPWTISREYRMVTVSGDGRWAVAHERNVTTIPVAVAELTRAPLRWRPFVRTVTGHVAGQVVGDRLVAVTDVGASRGRLVAIPIDAESPDDPLTWDELLPESDVVLRSVHPVEGVLYLTEFVDTYSRVRVLAPDGNVIGTVPLPGNGVVNDNLFPFLNLAQQNHAPKYVFGFSSLTASHAILAHAPGDDHVETLRDAETRLTDVVVEDLWATSPDGTRVPYHVVRRSDIDGSEPAPTLVYAYGGFSVPLLPQFPGAMAAFVVAGGVFVHAHLRGGGEFGVDWWRAGSHENKQNTYDDLYAIAEQLISDGRARAGGIAIVGNSNGGLTAGVAVTQRPDLWGAAVPRFPRLDLIGALRTPYGRHSTFIDRATDPIDPGQARRLAGISPYHLVRDAVRYPAVYVDAGDTDPRCLPQDARKFAARLQHATAGDAPIVVCVRDNVGHGWATDHETAIEQNTEWLAFVLRHLGVPEIVMTDRGGSPQ